MKIIRSQACPPIQWKNGGGTTQELAVFPASSGMDDFQWRLSLARIERAGGFSAFDGFDRVQAVVDGRLHLSGPDFAVTLDNQTPPFAFDGGIPVTADPLQPPVLALNAMARRGTCAIHMERLGAGAAILPDGVTIIIALEPQNLDATELAPFDCAVIDQPAVTKGVGILIRFRPLP